MAFETRQEEAWSEAAFNKFCSECGLEHLVGSSSNSPVSTPPCIDCASQIDPRNCTDACFVTFDDCNLCHASQIEKAPIWPLLAPAPVVDSISEVDDCSCGLDTIEIENASHSQCYRCMWSDCHACFLDQFSLAEHALTHTGVDMFSLLQHRTGLASAASPGHLSVTTHTNSHQHVHALTASEVHQCEWGDCTQTFESSSSLMDHILSDHVGSGKSEWRSCSRTHAFTQRQKIIRHVQGHTGDKPHVCEICQKSFSEKTALTQHMRTHSNDKPYHCSVEGCDKSFALASALTIHLRTHTGDKPFKCTYEGCTAAFAESSNLKKHVRTHTLEKNYICPEVDCGKRFARSDQLARHRKIHARQDSTAS